MNLRNVLLSEESIRTITSIALIFSFMLFLFSSITINEDFQKSFNEEKNKITGFALEDIKDSNLINESNSEENSTYSMKAYTFFYFTIIGLILIVTLVSIALLLPRIKKYT